MGLGHGASFLDPAAPLGWEASQTGDVASFEVDAIDVVRYLNSEDPTFSFSFTSDGAPEHDSAWTGQLTQLLAPGAVPEPSTLVLSLIALLALVGTTLKAGGEADYKTRMALKSFTLVWVGPVTTRSSSALKNP